MDSRESRKVTDILQIRLANESLKTVLRDVDETDVQRIDTAVRIHGVSSETRSPIIPDRMLGWILLINSAYKEEA